MKLRDVLPIVLTALCIGALVVVSGKVVDRPNYYLRPAEMAAGETKCVEEGGLTGLGVVVSKKVVTFTAICESGAEAIWQK